MTVIAGIMGKNRAMLAADSQAGIGYTDFNTRSKLYTKGGVIVGFAGEFLHARALDYAIDCQHCDSVAGVREWCYDLQASIKEAAGDTEIDGDAYILLVISPVAMFVCVGDGCVVQVEEPYFAVGSGAPTALGALSVLDFRNDALIESALSEAVNAAKKHSPGCGGRTDLAELTWKDA